MHHKGIWKFTISSLLSLIFATTALAVTIESANIGFGAVRKISDVEDFIFRHGVKPRAAHMWVEGLSGSYRTSQDVSAKTFVDMALSDSIRFFNDSLASNAEHIKTFLEQHAKSEILEKESLRISARSYLSLNRQLKAALLSLKSGHPIVYGLEVEGTPDQVNNASSDLEVSIFIRNGHSENLRQNRKRKSVKPQHLKNQAMDNYSATVAIEAVYQQLLTISNTIGGVK